MVRDIGEFDGSVYNDFDVQPLHSDKRRPRKPPQSVEERRRLARLALQSPPCEDKVLEQKKLDNERMIRLLRRLREAAEDEWDRSLRPIDVLVQLCVDAGVPVNELYGD